MQKPFQPPAHCTPSPGTPGEGMEPSLSPVPLFPSSNAPVGGRADSYGLYSHTASPRAAGLRRNDSPVDRLASDNSPDGVAPLPAIAKARHGVARTNPQQHRPRRRGRVGV